MSPADPHHCAPNSIEAYDNTSRQKLESSFQSTLVAAFVVAQDGFFPGCISIGRSHPFLFVSGSLSNHRRYKLPHKVVRPKKIGRLWPIFIHEAFPFPLSLLSLFSSPEISHPAPSTIARRPYIFKARFFHHPIRETKWTGIPFPASQCGRQSTNDWYIAGRWKPSTLGSGAAADKEQPRLQELPALCYSRRYQGPTCTRSFLESRLVLFDSCVCLCLSTWYLDSSNDFGHPCRIILAAAEAR